MTTHSSILAWRIPTDSPWDCKESDMTEQLSTAHILQLAFFHSGYHEYFPLSLLFLKRMVFNGCIYCSMT